MPLTTSQLLSGARKLLPSKKIQRVMVVGHSLGGALVKLDALFLVGNLAFAKLIDEKPETNQQQEVALIGYELKF
ncbi:hypothetical protein Hypma_007826 [Hypsizygus marmoreus]|uniref:Fungal lipase-type domain-containing protein n=1 Tax=Hypsizygus marmoreus TaxID=39966 RepID=A0A369K3J9_HYPMA|nr:hypothetical protein Hypma_007826 [Hypsizygus marmoreus]